MPSESIKLIAESINSAHNATSTVTIVLKTRYSCVVAHSHKANFLSRTQEKTRTIFGSKFSELAGIIAKVEDKKRVGVCLDTCKPISLFSI